MSFQVAPDPGAILPRVEEWVVIPPGIRRVYCEAFAEGLARRIELATWKNKPPSAALERTARARRGGARRPLLGPGGVRAR